MKKLTKAQRRVLRQVTKEAEARIWLSFSNYYPMYRCDINIARKLLKRGYLVHECRPVGSGWSWRLWPTTKGYAALNGVAQ